MTARLHRDDIPIPVLPPGNGKTKTGDCGFTFVTIGQRATPTPRLFGVLIRRTVRVNILLELIYDLNLLQQSRGLAALVRVSERSQAYADVRVIQPR